MDPRDRASRRLFAGLPRPELDPPAERALAELQPAGVILFDRNLRSVAQLRDLVAGVREVCRDPVLVAVDEEGGPVNRLRRVDDLFALLPDARRQATWPADRLAAVWRAVGRALRCLGFDVDFAPVVDLDAGSGRNAIGPRAWSDDPDEVVRCAGAVLGGLADAGIASCLKHFPGLGGTDVDTHRELAVSPMTPDRFETRDGRPFAELASRAPMVMTAHAWYPGLEHADQAPRPATFSRPLVHGLLRSRLGYDGVVVSDDLGMGALAGHGGPDRRAVQALAAGCDVALFCADLDAPRRARDAILAALRDGRLDEREHVEALARLGRLFARLHLDAPGPLPWQAWNAARDELEAVLGAT